MGCRRHPGLPCHDVLDGRGTCIPLLCSTDDDCDYKGCSDVGSDYGCNAPYYCYYIGWGTGYNACPDPAPTTTTTTAAAVTTTPAPVASTTTGTCNKQCDKIVADVEEIHYETNTTIKVKLRHPDKV